MGDFDFVPSVLERAGVKILFDRVNVSRENRRHSELHAKSLVFGLPGNPVSSFIQFEMLLRPLINKMMGHKWRPAEQNLPLGVNYERKSSSRLGLDSC